MIIFVTRYKNGFYFGPTHRRIHYLTKLFPRVYIEIRKKPFAQFNNDDLATRYHELLAKEYGYCCWATDYLPEETMRQILLGPATPAHLWSVHMQIIHKDGSIEEIKNKEEDYVQLRDSV